MIITDPVRRFAYILVSEEGCQGLSRSVQMFKVQKGRMLFILLANSGILWPRYLAFIGPVQ